jgi:hypothetical protein
VPDYAPVFLPGLVITLAAAGAITGGDPVEVAGNGTVQKTTAGPGGAIGSVKCIGVAAHDAVAGSRVAVVADRVVHEGAADGAVNAGDQLMASSKPGCQVKKVPDSTGTPTKQDVDQARCIIGLALTTAADGGTVRWMQK